MAKAKGYHEVKNGRGKVLGYACEHCEFQREDEAEAKDHVKKPGLHPKGGYRPRGGKRAGEVDLKGNAEGGDESPSDPPEDDEDAPAEPTEAEQIDALVDDHTWDQLAEMADKRSGTKQELAEQILAKREEA